MKLFNIEYLVVLAGILTVGLLAGCTPSLNADTYDYSSAGHAQPTVRGTVIDIRPVVVRRSGGLGGATGGAIGGIAGSLAGGDDHPRDNAMGAVGGAVAGAVVGNLIDKEITRKHALEYVIQTDSKRVVSVVQGTKPAIHKGERVLVMYGSKTRVVPA